jgi:hypothetical protein
MQRSSAVPLPCTWPAIDAAGITTSIPTGRAGLAIKDRSTKELQLRLEAVRLR